MKQKRRAELQIRRSNPQTH